jgi:hypothetical protein
MNQNLDSIGRCVMLVIQTNISGFKQVWNQDSSPEITS